MSRETLDQATSGSIPIALDVHALGLTDEQFYQLCRDNRDLRFELSARGELIIMPPTGSLTGLRNARLTHRITDWAERDATGVAFDSSTGFALPSGAKRSPDAAWVRLERWNALSETEKNKFAPLCPDFVIELRSPDDSLTTLQEKMAEYVENGSQLGWLLDPATKRVHIYRPGQPAEIQHDPTAVSGDPILPGFVLTLSEIW
jgi:Uma2 family endonuclease